MKRILFLLVLCISFNYIIGAEKLIEGVTVKLDSKSPTGYTATFVYKDSTAKSVKLNGWFYFAKPREPNAIKPLKYSPENWEKTMFPLYMNEESYTKNMTKEKDSDYWTVSLPLPSGAYGYNYLVDDVKTVDPENKPIENPYGSKQIWSIVYIPFDNLKQEVDYSFILPRKDGKNGKLVFSKYSTKGIVKEEQALNIYLPYNYDSKRTIPYKTIYLSHGFGGNESDWFNLGSIVNIMDNLVAENKTEPAIIVSMNNSIFNWDYPNVIKNIMENIIPYMESNYNVSKNPKNRAFGGLSRGGNMTTFLYYSKPLDFGYFGMLSGGYSGIDIASWYNLADLREPKLFLGVGCYDQAYLLGVLNPGLNMSTQQFQYKLGMNLINYDYKMLNGAHDWFLWPQLFKSWTESNLWK